MVRDLFRDSHRAGYGYSVGQTAFKKIKSNCTSTHFSVAVALPFRTISNVHFRADSKSLFLLTLPFLAASFAAAPSTQNSLADAELAVHTIYRDEFASKRPQDRIILAKLLLERGRSETSDASRRQVLLRNARDVATEIGDVPTACTAATELANDAHANPIELRGEALVSLAAHISSAQNAKTYIDECLKLADDAMLSGDYAPAARVLTLADKPAQSLKDRLLITRVRQACDEISTRARQADAMRQAEDLLRSHPDNSIANTLVGRERCFSRLDWKAGLPMLAKSDDVQLQLAAATELAAKSPTDTLHEADAWWDIAQKEIGPPRALTTCRAQRFYETIFPSLANADRDRAASRILQSLNTPPTQGRTFHDDPQALETLLGPHQSALANCLTFRKFSIRSDNPSLKRIYAQLDVASTRPLVAAEHVDMRLRVLCRDDNGALHILETRRALRIRDAGDSLLHLSGPEVDSVKSLNRGAWCPRNAHLAILIDNVVIWQQLWQTPERSAWWLDDSLLGK
jgi:hypothetical protein